MQSVKWGLLLALMFALVLVAAQAQTLRPDPGAGGTGLDLYRAGISNPRCTAGRCSHWLSTRLTSGYWPQPISASAS
ncbi:hypothetical protein GCM10027082_32960 [Comamonas humi]